MDRTNSMLISDNIDPIYQNLQLKYGIVGSSPPMREVIRLLLQSAPTDLSVLITGETGTGKEIFANALHGLSNRKKFPFVSVNCAAIPETLLESELFGNEKGAFTGAVEQRKGFFETAHRGTIFLDEIGEMPVATQVKLLRILETGEFSRLGSSAVHKVDIRLIAATNRTLEKEVTSGNFRQDLYFRLKSVQLHLPPLRNHTEDVPVLVEYFAWRVCSKISMQFQGISDDALNLLRSLPWHGNIRELRNLIETIVTLEKASFITPEIIRRYIPPALPPYQSEPLPTEFSLVPFDKHKDNQTMEFGLLFRTLLSIQDDINSLKTEIAQVQNSVNTIRYSFYDTVRSKEETQYTPEESISDDNLNLAYMEKKMIQSALQRTHGNRRLAAHALGISERTLYRKIEDYDIK